MKKTIKSLFAIAIAAFAFTACSDVEEPYTIPTKAGSDVVIAEPEGDGATPTTAFNVAAILEKLDELGGTSTESYYIKGKVASIKEAFSANFGNAQFTISDDGTTSKTFTAYRVKYLENKAWTEGNTQIQVGDEVILYGKVVIYNGTYETAQNEAYLYSLNGKTKEEGGTPPPTETAEGDGLTAATAFNVAAVRAKCDELGGAESGDSYYIKGKVSSIKEAFGAQFGNAQFNISFDGSTTAQQFTAYRVLYLENKKWVEGNTQIQVGDEVILYGKIVIYNGTYETAQNNAYLHTLNGKTSEGGGTPPPTPGTATGTGTEEDPFNVAAAVAKCKEVGETVSTDSYYIKGIVDADYTVDSFKNATFDLVDQEGASEKFKVYRIKATGNKNLKEGYKIPKGAVVVVYGKIINYKGNTPETSQNNAFLISVDGNEPELAE